METIARIWAILLSITVVSPMHMALINGYNSTVRNVINSACPAMPIRYITNTNAPNWMFGSLQPGQYTNMINLLSQNNKLVKCPDISPFSNGEVCLNCPPNQVFNLMTRVCQSCPPGLVFGVQERRCIGSASINPQIVDPIPTNPIINPILTNPIIPPVIVSPVVTPVLTNPIVSPVVTSPILNPIVTSPIIDPLINPIVKNQPIRYLTNPRSKNLIFGRQGQEQYVRRFQFEKQSFPICPQITPYFNGDRCIACNPQNPMFDLETRQCISCPPTKRFDPQLNRCITKMQVTPTLQRALMNLR